MPLKSNNGTSEDSDHKEELLLEKRDNVDEESFSKNFFVEF
jgi:hypothetical protein